MGCRLREPQGPVHVHPATRSADVAGLVFEIELQHVLAVGCRHQLGATRDLAVPAHRAVAGRVRAPPAHLPQNLQAGREHGEAHLAALTGPVPERAHIGETVAVGAYRRRARRELLRLRRRRVHVHRGDTRASGASRARRRRHHRVGAVRHHLAAAVASIPSDLYGVPLTLERAHDRPASGLDLHRPVGGLGDRVVDAQVIEPAITVGAQVRAAERERVDLRQPGRGDRLADLRQQGEELVTGTRCVACLAVTGDDQKGHLLPQTELLGVSARHGRLSQRVDVVYVELPREQALERRYRCGRRRHVHEPAHHRDTGAAAVEAQRLSADDPLGDATLATLIDGAVAVYQEVVADIAPVQHAGVVVVDAAHDAGGLGARVVVGAIGVMDEDHAHGTVLRRPRAPGFVGAPLRAGDDGRLRHGAAGGSTGRRLCGRRPRGSFGGSRGRGVQSRRQERDAQVGHGRRRSGPGPSQCQPVLQVARLADPQRLGGRLVAGVRCPRAGDVLKAQAPPATPMSAIEAGAHIHCRLRASAGRQTAQHTDHGEDHAGLQRAARRRYSRRHAAAGKARRRQRRATGQHRHEARGDRRRRCAAAGLAGGRRRGHRRQGCDRQEQRQACACDLIRHVCHLRD